MTAKPENKSARQQWKRHYDEEFRLGMSGTKWELFCCSAHLFAEYDYSSISMRHIAGEIGIKPASIYNHFESKDKILQTMYNYLDFYTVKYIRSLDYYLAQVETADPVELLISTSYSYPDQIEDLMGQLLLICQKQMRRDERAQKLIKEIMVDVVDYFIRNILEALVAKNRIQPLDIDAFVELCINCYYGASMRLYSSSPSTHTTWAQAHRMLMSIVKKQG